ncbi:uncharacterized protein LOC143028137 isoform X2 [Oratosquilla oratoria]
MGKGPKHGGSESSTSLSANKKSNKTRGAPAPSSVAGQKTNNAPSQGRNIGGDVNIESVATTSKSTIPVSKNSTSRCSSSENVPATECSTAKSSSDCTGGTQSNKESEGSKTSNSTHGECFVCGNQTDTRCTGCKLVFYCSRDCQRDNWKLHKDVCRPYKVTKLQDLGRVLVASRDLPAGEVILEEAPLVIGPKQITEPICLGCYRRVDGSYRCSKCSWPMCGSKCEEDPTHAPECDVTRRAGVYINIDNFTVPHHLYEVVTVLRGLMTAGQEPKRWRTGMERLNTRYLQLVGSPQYHENHQKVVQVLRTTFQLTNYPQLDASEAAIHTMLGLLQINHVPTKTPYGEVQALYPQASLMSHSCIPNTKAVWTPEAKLVLKTVEPIEKGANITAMYTDILWGTRARRHHLRHSRVIDCRCRRCRDNTELGTNFSALRCPKCPKASPVLSTSPLDDDAIWTCIKCKYEVLAPQVLQTNLELGAEVEEALLDPTIVGLEALQERWSKRVGSNHYHLHAVKHSLLQLYARSQEKAEDKDASHWVEVGKKEKACKEFLTVCSKLDPSTAYTIPYVGVTFFEYHKTILQNAKQHFAQAAINTQQLKKRMLLAKALLKKAMEIFKLEAEDTPEGQLYLTCQEEVIAIGKWMLAVGLI